jgi:outer membrane protein OmpA-like peptidoglycan-associated protein
VTISASKRVAGIAAALSIAVVGAVDTSPAHAQEGLELQRFLPMPTLSRDLFNTSGSDVLQQWEVEAHVIFDYAHRPLVLLDADGERLGAVVKSQTTANLLFALGFGGGFDIGFAMPLYIYQPAGSQTIPGYAEGDAGFGPGDLRVIPRIQLWTNRDYPGANGMGLALMVDTFVPVGDEAKFQGAGFRVGPRLAFDAIVSGVRMAANVGYLWRERADVETATVGQSIGWSAGADIPIASTLSVTGDIGGRFNVGENGVRRAETPMELLIGMKLRQEGLFGTFGGGAGLVNGIGTPDFRAFLGMGYAAPMAPPPPPPECTADTVASDCPAAPAPVCSGNAVLSYRAICTAAGDCGMATTSTTCGADEYCDEALAACVPIPECRLDGDCAVPAPTCADDTLQTWSCRCLDGSCACDATPTPCGDNICGEVNGVAACVAPPPVVVDVETRQIVITENVFFATNSDRIEERSYPILNHVAQVLIDNPHITRVRVEGHTDNVGRARDNLRLSQRRAASVVRYLTERGIDADRLESEGYGQTRPIASNDDEQGRAQNRRVEFHIIDRD